MHNSDSDRQVGLGINLSPEVIEPDPGEADSSDQGSGDASDIKELQGHLRQYPVQSAPAGTIDEPLTDLPGEPTTPSEPPMAGTYHHPQTPENISPHPDTTDQSDFVDVLSNQVGTEVGSLADDPWQLTPEGDAERLLRAHAEQILIAAFRDKLDRYWHRLYILEENGLWKSSAAMTDRLLSDVSRDWTARAMAELEEGAAKAAVNHLIKSAHTSHARRVLDRTPVIAARWGQTGDSDLQRLTLCSMEDLDSNAQFLGVNNGIIDLTVGHLLPDNEARRALVTRSVGIDFDSDASHWTTNALLEHLDPELRETLLAILGQALWGKPAKLFLVLVGPTNCGKSTVLRALAAALGPEVKAFSSAALSATRARRGGPTPELGPLVESRMVTATEFERWRVDPATLKQVIGGDLVPHQPKFEAERTSPVRATLILSGNSLPYLGLFDPAVVERFRLVPFPKPDNDFSKILELFLNRDEAASKAMLRLLVDYARAYPPGKRIDVPPAMATAIDDAIEEECGRFAPWMNRNIVDDPRGKITTDQLWNAWARDLFRAPAKDMIDGITRQDAIRALRLRFNLGPAKPIRIGQQIGRGWSGVRLKDAAELAAAEGAPPAGVQGSDIESI